MKIFLIGLTLLANITFGATKNDPHLPISHCYHWINEGSNKYLSFKYNYASEHSNELTFYTTPASSNGSVAGPGLYCAKSPSGSYSYGDRLIRVELVDDIVLYDDNTGITHCGLDGANSNNSSDCGRKNWDIKFYSGGGIGNSAWYVIQNPEAIKSWSSNSDQLIQDLNTSIAINDSSFGSHAQQAIMAMNEERKRTGIKDFHTQTERSSIIKIILEQPDKLKSIPAFNVISRLTNEKSEKLSLVERKEIYLRSLDIALKSHDTDYNSYLKLMSIDEALEETFYSFIQKKINQYNNYNQVVFLEASMKNSSTSANQLKNMVTSILSNKQLAKELSSKAIIKDSRIKGFVVSELNNLEANGSLVEDLPLMVNLIEQLFDTKEISRRKQKLLTHLQSENNSLVKIKISNIDFGIDPNKDNKNLCKSALKLVGKSEVVKLKYFKSEFDLVKITDDNSINNVCDTIDNLTKSLIAIKDSDKEIFKYQVTGRFELTPYFFIGANRDQITTQCHDYYRNIPNPDQVDEIYWSLNGSSEHKLYNKSEYWKTKNAVCGQIESAIASSVPTRAEIVAEQKYKELITKWSQAQNNSSASYKVTGKFEQIKYFFFGANRDEIMSQCNDYYQYIPNPEQIDEIYWSVNGSSEQRLYNQSEYWKTKNAVCGQIENAITSSVPTKAEIIAEQKYNELVSKWSRAQNNSKAAYKVTGKFEQIKYFFFGANRDEIMSQCNDYYQYITNPAQVDEIFWSVNGSSEQRLYNKSEYWKTKNEVCGQIENVIKSSVPTKAEIVAEQKYNELISKWNQDQHNSKVAYKITGRFEQTKYFFFGESQEEIRSQCDEIYQYIPNPDSIDEIYISLNGSNEAKLYNSSSFWKTQNEVCNQVINAISSKVPSKKQIQEKIKYNLITKKWSTAFEKSNAKYKVSGRFDSFDFYFFGPNRNDIIDQCHIYYDELINQNSISTLYYAINGGTEQRQSSGYRDLDSKNKLCSFLDSTLNPGIPSIDQIVLERRKKEVFNAYLKELKTSFEQSTESYSIAGKLGDYEYYFTGNSSEEIAQKCSEFQQSYPDRQETLSLSVTINKTKKRTDRRINISELCSTLTAESTKEILTKFEVEKDQFITTERANFTNAPLPFNFELSINGEALYLNVNHNQEIGQKCINASRYLTNLSQQNQVTFKNENNEDEEFNIELEDYTVNHFCTQLEFKLLSFIPTKEILKMKEEWNRSTKQFKLSGVYGQAPYYFAADSAKEFGDICEDNFDMLKDLNQDTKVEIFKWKVEGATTTYTVSSSSTLRSRRSLCRIFERNLKKQL